MQKKKLALILLLVILVMAVAVPAYANGNPKNGKEPVGVRISFFDENGVIVTEQTVSGPFHVLHGHLNEPKGGAFGKANFTLEIDDEEQDGRFVSEKIDGDLYHRRLYNFPEGLPPGEYLFKGTWDDPCFWFSDDCEKKNALADPPYALEMTVTVLP